jgi:hypothetical protein
MRDPIHPPLKDLEHAPLLDPPETLWPRLRDRQRKAVAHRRLLAGACATALVVALAAVLPGATPIQVEPAPAQAAADDVLEQIVTLDRALQAAYESDASDHEIAPMWAARAQLIHDLSPARPN